MELPSHAPPGHEQEGPRPVVVVGVPERVGKPRFPVIVAAPLTSATGDWVSAGGGLYPLLRAGTGGLSRDSVVMLEHLRGVDATRVLRRLGSLSAEAYAPIRGGLEAMLK